MIQNYIKIAFRTILKNRSYALLNVAGLSLGLASAFLIFALVRYHFNIDQHHANADRIYRVTTQFLSPGGNGNTTGVPYPFGKNLRTDHPQIEQVCMIEEIYEPMVLIEEKGQIKKLKDAGQNHRGAFVEPNFFKIFDYQWVAGGIAEMANPNTVVLSEKYANKFFGTTQCIGKVFKYEGRLSLKVVGVFADYQDNTDFPFNIMPSYASLKEYLGGPLNEDFGSINSSTQCFVLLNDKFTKANWDKQSINFVKKHKPDGVKDTRFMITNLRENHFSPDFGQVSKNLAPSLRNMISLFILFFSWAGGISLQAQEKKRMKRKIIFLREGAIFFIFSIILSFGTSTKRLLTVHY